MSTKTVMCSAGISHLLLYPNGDVFRCMADYNARRAPLFNAKQGWKTLETPTECPHDTCYAACDLDWTKKWIFEERESGSRDRTAAEFHGEPHGHRGVG